MKLRYIGHSSGLSIPGVTDSLNHGDEFTVSDRVGKELSGRPDFIEVTKKRKKVVVRKAKPKKSASTGSAEMPSAFSVKGGEIDWDRDTLE